MVLPTSPASSWLSSTGTPSRLFGTGSSDHELYEQDGEYVLSTEMPGFDPDEIDVSWHESRLIVTAEREDDRRDQQRTYHRTFRMPEEIDDENIKARYENGILDIYLPSVEDARPKGRTIPIES
jgi:HSP20 family protein